MVRNNNKLGSKVLELIQQLFRYSFAHKCDDGITTIGIVTASNEGKARDLVYVELGVNPKEVRYDKTTFERISHSSSDAEGVENVRRFEPFACLDFFSEHITNPLKKAA